MRVTTPTATLDLTLEDAGGTCHACDAQAPELVAIAVEHRDGRIDLLAVCGQCLARGLAIAFGVEHVNAGGRVEDLRRECGAMTELGDVRLRCTLPPGHDDAHSDGRTRWTEPVRWAQP